MRGKCCETMNWKKILETSGYVEQDWVSSRAAGSSSLVESVPNDHVRWVWMKSHCIPREAVDVIVRECRDLLNWVTLQLAGPTAEHYSYVVILQQKHFKGSSRGCSCLGREPVVLTKTFLSFSSYLASELGKWFKIHYGRFFSPLCVLST
jgi:hypothetical protein